MTSRRSGAASSRLGCWWRGGVVGIDGFAPAAGRTRSVYTRGLFKVKGDADRDLCVNIEMCDVLLRKLHMLPTGALRGT